MATWIYLAGAALALAIVWTAWTGRNAKNVFSFRLHFMQGMTFPDLMRFFWSCNFAIHPVYWPRAAFLVLASIYTSYRKSIEDKKYGKRLAEMKLATDPVFIIGHYRSGTTLLHELMALHTEKFVFPTVYQCWQPHTFLHTQKYVLRKFGEEKFQRPMDNMIVKLASPQEDEFGLCSLCTYSPYSFMVFPRSKPKYFRFSTFKTASEKEIQKWKNTIVYFLKKITYFDTTKRPLLKSPIHTARIRLLLELFPNARFIHVHRDPYEVFLSTRHLHQTLMTHFNLQPLPTGDQLDETIFEHYEEMYDAYLDERNLIPEGHLAEVSFKALSCDPVTEIRKVYEKLGLPGIDELLPRLQNEVSERKRFTKNSYKDLAGPDREKVTKRLARFIRAFGYDCNDNHGDDSNIRRLSDA